MFKIVHYDIKNIKFMKDFSSPPILVNKRSNELVETAVLRLIAMAFVALLTASSGNASQKKLIN